MDYDVAVAGLGGMGSAILAQCATRGARAIGLEQFARGHEMGSSSGKSRLIRKAYFEDPRYVPLLLRAYDLWRELERESGGSVSAWYVGDHRGSDVDAAVPKSEQPCDERRRFARSSPNAPARRRTSRRTVDGDAGVGIGVG